MVKSLFISKSEGELGQLRTFAESADITLASNSFLQFEPIDFQIPTNYEVIFFGSPRAVMFFQSRYAIPKDVAIASVGGKTSTILKTLGYDVAFSGEGKGSISDVAKAFEKWLGDRTVLFPVSNKSLGTMSKNLPSRQTLHVKCYQTNIVSKKISDTFDTYVFTSPSNVRGFFKENVLSEDVSIIAWGESTEKALKEVVNCSILVLPQPTEEALIQHIQAKK